MRVLYLTQAFKGLEELVEHIISLHYLDSNLLVLTLQSLTRSVKVFSLLFKLCADWRTDAISFNIRVKNFKTSQHTLKFIFISFVRKRHWTFLVLYYIEVLVSCVMCYKKASIGLMVAFYCSILENFELF